MPTWTLTPSGNRFRKCALTHKYDLAIYHVTCGFFHSINNQGKRCTTAFWAAPVDFVALKAHGPFPWSVGQAWPDGIGALIA